jgi:hypothetical protein
MPGTHAAPSDVPVLRRSDCTSAFLIFPAHVKLSTDSMQLLSGAIAVSPQPATQPTAHACANRLPATSTIRDTTLVQSSPAQPRRNRDRQLKARTQLPNALLSAPADFMVEPHTVRRRRPAHHTTSACHSSLCCLPDSHGQPLLTTTVGQLPFVNIAILPLPPTNCVARATAGPERSY